MAYKEFYEIIFETIVVHKILNLPQKTTNTS